MCATPKKIYVCPPPPPPPQSVIASYGPALAMSNTIQKEHEVSNKRDTNTCFHCSLN